MSLLNESENSKDDQLSSSLYDQLTSIQERISSLENQIKEIESDLPPNVSKSILNMQKEIQTLTEISDSQPAKEVPYVYSETLEKIGDFQRRIEWKIKDTVQNKISDTNLQFEENSESPRENKKNETIEFQSKITESLKKLKSNVDKTFEENKKSLNELEAQLIQIKFQIQTTLNAPSQINTYISNEIDLHQKQINELERTLNNIPNLIHNSRRLTEKFSNIYQPNEISQPYNTQNKENIGFENMDDLTISFSNLESEVQTTICSLRLDLENVLKRIDIVDQKSTENEKQIMKIADTQRKAAEILSGIEDTALSMLDKADDFTSKLAAKSNSDPMEEIEIETREQIRVFKQEISTIKSEISKKEAQIEQYSHSTT